MQPCWMFSLYKYDLLELVATCQDDAYEVRLQYG